MKRKIDYWEFPNELEGSYERAERLDDLWRLYNKIAVAIRKEDPNAKTGGPALTYAKAEWVQGFLKNCLSNTDFITWHNYGTGDHFGSNESLFSKVDSNIGSHARGVLACQMLWEPSGAARLPRARSTRSNQEIRAE